MLTSALFTELRAREFSRLDRTGEAYLDYTGAALYAESRVALHAQKLNAGVFGNPHSENGPSRSSTTAIDEARSRILEFLDAPEDEYSVCLTANTTAAIKLVGEGFRFSPHADLVLTADNHNSMNGLREFAHRRGSRVRYIPLSAELRLESAPDHLKACRGGLLGYPAQSNFSGVRHPLDLVIEAQALGYQVLLDAAALLPTSRISLRAIPADFVAFSAYKIFGYPTGVGALVARKESLAHLQRPWFSGGTVEYASVQLERHLLRPFPEGLEDGTPSFLSLAALADGFDFHESIGPEYMGRHISSHTEYALERISSLVFDDGSPAVAIYGPRNCTARGGTISFNVLARDGSTIPFAHVIDRARERGVSLRGGCFCNPGAAEAAFGFPRDATERCLGLTAIGGFSIERLSECLGPKIPVGAVRASFGAATNRRDIDRSIEVLQSFM